MNGILNDQATAERLCQRVGERYRYTPAFGCWWRWNRDRWDQTNAEAFLREELVALLSEVEEGGKRELYEKARQTMAAAQKAVLWLLQLDTRLLTEPREIKPVLTSSEEEENNPLLVEAARAYFPGTPEKILSFTTHAHMRSVQTPRILVRTTRQAACPSGLFPIFKYIWPERVVSLPVKIWSTWPERLTPEWAERLWGCWFVFLEAPETNCRTPFPQEALMRLLRPTQEWLGADRIWREMPMPLHYLLCGAPVNTHQWSAELFAHCLEVRPNFPEASE